MYLYLVLLIPFVTILDAFLEVPFEFRKGWEGVAETFRSECICEMGVSSALAIDFFLRGEYSVDLCIYCYIKCIHLKMNLMSASTSEFIEYEFVRQIAGTTPSMISKCNNGTVGVKDPCLKSYYMYACIVTSLLVSV
ncbi:hypothetical protein RN001_000117 [Aquatica leii]|uniref:Uncharacterized protein n=1 Tax=Aquatica leii TaxID=1421715 RepID=A0AAN7SC19_9COLE|nr:hypothetical protein RN001_000117 [Aquatica leii]